MIIKSHDSDSSGKRVTKRSFPWFLSLTPKTLARPKVAPLSLPFTLHFLVSSARPLSQDSLRQHGLSAWAPGTSTSQGALFPTACQERRSHLEWGEIKPQLSYCFCGTIHVGNVTLRGGDQIRPEVFSHLETLCSCYHACHPISNSPRFQLRE